MCPLDSHSSRASLEWGRRSFPGKQSASPVWPLEALARGRFGHFLRKLPNLVAVSYLQTPSPLSWALYSS